MIVPPIVLTSLLVPLLLLVRSNYFITIVAMGLFWVWECSLCEWFRIWVCATPINSLLQKLAITRTGRDVWDTLDAQCGRILRRKCGMRRESGRRWTSFAREGCYRSKVVDDLGAVDVEEDNRHDEYLVKEPAEPMHIVAVVASRGCACLVFSCYTLRFQHRGDYIAYLWGREL